MAVSARSAFQSRAEAQHDLVLHLAERQYQTVPDVAVDFVVTVDRALCFRFDQLKKMAIDQFFN